MIKEGWTGRPCPHCKGTGAAYDERGEEISCRKCGGTGDEYRTAQRVLGIVPDNAPNANATPLVAPAHVSVKDCSFCIAEKRLRPYIPKGWHLVSLNYAGEDRRMA